MKKYALLLLSAVAFMSAAAQTNAYIKLHDKKGKHPRVLSITYPGNADRLDMYNSIYGHGAVIENPWVAYRVYMDNRQSLDLYAKQTPKLELDSTGFYTTRQQLADGYGCDILWAGKSVGAGSFRGWNGKEPLTIDSVASRTQTVVNDSTVTVTDKEWIVNGTPLNMTQTYSMKGDSRDLWVEIALEGYRPDQLFCTGIQKLESKNRGEIWPEGYAVSWGENVPDKGGAPDIVEGVGLAIVVDPVNVAGTLEDDVNYLVLLRPDSEGKIRYRVIAAGTREQNGFTNYDDWKAYILKEKLREPDTNPVLPGFHADPEILYSQKTGKYYIYSTTDGTPGWGGHDFRVFSSPDLDVWTDEGVVLDLAGEQVKWATGNAWAPAIIERKEGKNFRYYLYFSGHNPATNRKEIGVAVADNPTGPFTDLGHPIVTDSPAGRGQQIDVDVFRDPKSGKYYLYWGNGYMAGAELNADMTSVKPETITLLTPKGGTLQDYAYREAPYVFYRKGKYYFMWSVDDTGSPNYHVAYGTASKPLGPVTVADKPVVLVQNPEKQIYGTAHNSVIQLPGSDEWRIVYHRINPAYLDNGMPPADKSKSPGTHRQVCIDRMTFNPDGTIAPVEVH